MRDKKQEMVDLICLLGLLGCVAALVILAAS